MSEPLPGQMGMLAAAKPGIPLTVVATMGDKVSVEDPDGVPFTIPREWIKQDVEHDFNLDHKAIDAPPGELEKIWREATYAYDQSMDPGGFGGETGSSNATVSNLDDYNAGRWNPLSKDEISKLVAEHYDDVPPTRGGIPMAGEIPSTGTGWRPMMAKKPTNPNPSGVIPPDAGSGWGNQGDVWDPRTQSWKRR